MDNSTETIRVMHVDDESDFGELTADFLQREDDRFHVVTETDASTALDRFNTGDFDSIVSDYQMPEIDGLTFLTNVRESHPDFPFILFTGRGSEEIASDAISAGVTDYIQKGSGTSQYTVLANRIRNAVERYRAIRQRDLHHRAMETASEGISLVEPDGTFSYVNPAFAGLFEYDTNELVDRHWTVLYHNEEADRLKADILPAIPETGYWAGETVRLTKHGDRLVTDHRLAYTDEDVIVCTARDVTGERTGSPEQVGGFARLIEALEDQAFYTLDHEGYVTRWNEGAERISGYDVDEMLGVHVAECFTEDDRKQGVPEQLLETAMDDGVVSHEGWQVRGDGSRFWSEVTIAADYDGTGTIRGYAVAVRESTRQLANQRNHPIT